MNDEHQWIHPSPPLPLRLLCHERLLDEQIATSEAANVLQQHNHVRWSIGWFTVPTQMREEEEEEEEGVNERGRVPALR
jgi:hypothetical protein